MSKLQVKTAPKAFFLQTRHGPCFCIFHSPKGPKKNGSILYLHPFAEELNTTRRIVAYQARNLAELGYGVLQIDLHGCGDSSGNFEDATWATWIDTAQEAHEWLMKNGSEPIWFWGMRGGALLANALLNQQYGNQINPVNMLLWQPVINGQQMLKQYLRIKEAGEWMGKQKTNAIPAEKIWAQGGNVEIAGYSISSALANGLANARMTPPECKTGGILVWIEMSSHTKPSLNPVSEKSLGLWREAGWKVQGHAVTGNTFWQNIGTADEPDLCSATKHAMESETELLNAKTKT